MLLISHIQDGITYPLNPLQNSLLQLNLLLLPSLPHPREMKMIHNQLISTLSFPLITHPSISYHRLRPPWTMPKTPTWSAKMKRSRALWMLCTGEVIGQPCITYASSFTFPLFYIYLLTSPSVPTKFIKDQRHFLCRRWPSRWERRGRWRTWCRRWRRRRVYFNSKVEWM